MKTTGSRPVPGTENLLERLRAAIGDRYHVERQLGEGGMAIVFLATDLKHKRRVAIKVLRPDLTAALGADRFLSEIEIIAKLQHPHILPLHDSGSADGLLYYVMPFVEGESLRNRLARQGVLPWGDAATIAREVASALEYAHAQNVIHRDVKPGNILLSQGHAMVADFGIARGLSRSGEEGRLTLLEFGLGTPAYMSPEQRASDPELDGRSDVYSLGCVLYEMLTGRAPVEDVGGSRSRWAGALGDAVAGIPRAVRRIVRKALDEDRTRRFGSAGAMATALASVATTGGLVRTTALLIAASGALVALVYFLALQLDLPNWVFQILLVLVTLQTVLVVMANAAERRGSRDGTRSRRRLQLGGATAAGILGVAVVVYVALRFWGIGPAAALVTAGVLDERERILLADFANRTGDSLLGHVVTEAFRVDFSQTPLVTVVDRAYVTNALERMRRPPGNALTLQLALEVAVREGIKAVLGGEVTSVGTGYVLSASVVSARDESVLAAERVTASDQNAIIPAIDELSNRMRERVGESLRGIRRSEPLGDVTTGSLEALRKYSQAVRVIDNGDFLRGRTLLQEAVDLDPSFAMALRKLGTVSLDRAGQVDAVTRAWRFRDRLTDRERYLTEGTYHAVVTGDLREAIDAYTSLLDLHPTDGTALHNLGDLYHRVEAYGRAQQLQLRAIAADPLSPVGYLSLVRTTITLGGFEEARKHIASMEARFPDHVGPDLLEILLASAQLDYRTADRLIRSFEESQSSELVWRLWAQSALAGLDLLWGRVNSASNHVQVAIGLSEQIGVPASALTGEIQLGFIDLLFREDTASALTRLDNALDRYPLRDIDSRNRPYRLIAELLTCAGQTERARATFVEFGEQIDPVERQFWKPVEHEMQVFIDLGAGRVADAIEGMRAPPPGACGFCMLPYLGEAYDRIDQVDSTVAVLERYLTTPWADRYLIDPLKLVDTYEILARRNEELGNYELATEYNRRIVDLWSEADAVLRPRLQAARDALDRLSRAR